MCTLQLEVLLKKAKSGLQLNIQIYVFHDFDIQIKTSPFYTCALSAPHV